MKFDKFDNNTIAVFGLVVALIVSLFYGSENISIGIASGLVGFITGVSAKTL